VGVTRRRPAKVVNALAPVFALMLLFGTAMPVYANDRSYYAGEQSASTYADGIDGYIRQSTSRPISGQLHANWIGVCSPTACGNTWVQTGEIQGWPDPSRSMVYTETWDACGRHNILPWGVAPANQAYYVFWDHTGWSETCPAGTPNAGQYVFEYEYAFAKGSLTNVYYHGIMGVSQGIFAARTEIQPNQTVTIGQDFFGCSGVATCWNAGYGIHYHTASGWILWTGNGGAFPPDNPPSFKQYQFNWAFETCPVNGCI
jgi:hypothetical protein